MFEDNIEALLRRLDKAEGNYLELLASYQALIHDYEVLKEQHQYLETDYDCMVALAQQEGKL